MAKTTEEKWAALQREQRASGLTVTAWCRHKGLNPKSFYNLKSRAEKTGGRFVRLDSAPGLVLELRSGVRLKIEAEFDAELLRKVVEALSAEG